MWSTFILTPIYIIISYFIFDVKMTCLIELNNLTVFDWLIYLLSGVISFFAIGGISRAFQLDTMVNISIVLYSEVLFGVIFQCILLHDTTDFNRPFFWIGIFLIIACTMVVVIRGSRSVDSNEEEKKPLITRTKRFYSFDGLNAPNINGYKWTEDQSMPGQEVTDNDENVIV